VFDDRAGCLNGISPLGHFVGDEPAERQTAPRHATPRHATLSHAAHRGLVNTLVDGTAAASTLGGIAAPPQLPTIGSPD
jgi:hypothetical protein